MRQILFVLARSCAMHADPTITFPTMSKLTQFDAVLMSLRNVMFRPDTRQQVQQEAKDVTGKDEGDDPLQDGADVSVVGKGGAREGDGRGDLD